MIEGGGSDRRKTASCNQLKGRKFFKKENRSEEGRTGMRRMRGEINEGGDRGSKKNEER